MNGERWKDVDTYLGSTLGLEDAALRQARVTTQAAGLPSIEVSSAQGALLALLCRMVSARRVLEFGTLGGYSTIWLARAVGDSGHVDTLEIDPRHADVARRNLDEAGVGDRVEIHVGPAAQTVVDLIATAEPYDLVFVDADKPSNTDYVEAALRLAHPGTVIVVDNVVRAGGVVDGTDRSSEGSRRVLRFMADEPRLTVTAIQTVGSKGWDGFAVAVVG